MSQLRIQRIEAKAFKAFKHLDFKLDGRNLLAYGANGSGKSSLYWTLYTFLQSAQKESTEVVKYFDKYRTENLINRYASDDERDAAAIAVTLQDESESIGCIYTLSANQQDTLKVSDILKGSLASDFITYRILFSFYHFRNSQSIDLWPVFEQEMLPFCQGTGVKDIAGLWKDIQETKPFETSVASGESPWYRKKRYEKFDRQVERFNTALTGVLTSITKEAQLFYDQNFSNDKEPKLHLIVGMTRPTSKYYRDRHFHLAPAIGFEIKMDGTPISKPHAFLNEAKLTQLALSVRFGATLAHLHDSPFKLLVLDDLLISLDMENRMKVVDIILSETFADYQKIILTHDLGFFNEFRRRIGGQHISWSFQHFKNPSAQTGSTLKETKSEIQKAEDYLHGQSLDEAATCLRKAADDSAKRLREWLSKEKLPPGEFFSLTQNLREAKKRLLLTIPKQLYEKVLKGTPSELLQKLIPSSVADLDAEADLEPAERGKINSKRGTLRKLLTDTHWVAMENVRLIDEVLATTERVLNPGAHGGETPLYEAEVEIALDLIRRLEKCSP